MPRDYKVCLEDIAEAISKIRDYTEGLEYSEFLTSSKTIDAVVRNLEVIGEAVKGLPEEVRSRYPGVEWKKVAGLRDILIHEYFGVDLEIVWDIVRNKIPALEEQVKKILEQEGDPDDPNI